MLHDNQSQLPLLSLPPGPLAQGAQSGLGSSHSCIFSGTLTEASGGSLLPLSPGNSNPAEPRAVGKRNTNSGNELQGVRVEESSILPFLHF